LVLFSHQVASAFAITEIAAIVIRPGKAFIHPGPVAAELSRIALESGDAVASRRSAAESHDP
jgi:hypothetical protein